MMMKKFVTNSVRQDTMQPMEFGKKSKRRTKNFAKVTIARPIDRGGFPDHYIATLTDSVTGISLGLNTT
jgi:hypothetical protein